MVDPAGKLPTPDYSERLDELVAAGDRSAAAAHFMRNAIGIPAAFVALMRLMPMWKSLKSVAHTLPYDWAALGSHNMYGKPLLPAEWASVTAPTLVAYGSKSALALQKGSRALAEVLPNANLRALEDQNHNVSMKVLVPVLETFFTTRDPDNTARALLQQGKGDRQGLVEEVSSSSGGGSGRRPHGNGST
jgi:pimeloyl-ACP methyl ester carboxylesterase